MNGGRDNLDFVTENEDDVFVPPDINNDNIYASDTDEQSQGNETASMEEIGASME